MITFREFLLESHFHNEDYVKDDYKYLRPVISDIVNNGKIGLGDKTLDKEVEIDQNIRDQFAKFQNAPQLLSLNDFNELLASNTIPVKWTKIYKGKYSGQEGSTSGQYAEAAVAYIFNVMNGNNEITEADDNTYDEISKVLKDKDVSLDWIASSRLSAEKLHKEVDQPKKYVAAHVDGNDISRIPENVKKIATILHGKPGIKKILGTHIDSDALNNLYTGQKDTWNKADIVLVDSQFNIEDEVKDLHFSISAEFNRFFNDIINKGYIIPVSLKKIPAKAALEQISFKKEGYSEESEQAENEIDEIKDAYIELPKNPLATDEDHKYAATCYLKTPSGLEIDFRAARANKPQLSIELKLKTARGGKAMTELKNKLQLHSNFYTNEHFSSESDFINTLKQLTGMRPEVSKKMSASDEQWYMRPAFKGLVALLKIYHSKIEKNSTKYVDLDGFFKLVYNCASGANSESIFWLLTMK